MRVAQVVNRVHQRQVESGQRVQPRPQLGGVQMLETEMQVNDVELALMTGQPGRIQSGAGESRGRDELGSVRTGGGLIDVGMISGDLKYPGHRRPTVPTSFPP